MKKINFIIIILSLTICILEVVNVYFINKISTDSIYASEIRDKIKKYNEENLLLKTEVLNYSSFSMISSRAAELGFKEGKEFISLYSPLEIAVRK